LKLADSCCVSFRCEIFWNTTSPRSLKNQVTFVLILRTFAGELALSLLAKAISPQTRGDLEASNNQWRRVRLLYEARVVTNPKPAAGSLNRKFRFVGQPLSLLFLFSAVHRLCSINLISIFLHLSILHHEVCLSGLSRHLLRFSH